VSGLFGAISFGSSYFLVGMQRQANGSVQLRESPLIANESFELPLADGNELPLGL
jgi:hypothetical protein